MSGAHHWASLCPTSLPPTLTLSLPQQQKLPKSASPRENCPLQLTLSLETMPPSSPSLFTHGSPHTHLPAFDQWEPRGTVGVCVNIFPWFPGRQEDFKRVEFSKCGPVHDAKFGSAVMGHVKQQPALEPCFRVKIISSGSCYK